METTVMAAPAYAEPLPQMPLPQFKTDPKTGRQLRLYQRGTEKGESVIFDGLNDGKEAVWVINTYGKAMCLDINRAFEFVNKPGRKYRFAKTEEIPFAVTEKIYPYDHNKKPEAQAKSNVSISGREVSELVNQGINPLDQEISFKELKDIAKANNIKIFGKRKDVLEIELRSKGLIQNK